MLSENRFYLQRAKRRAFDRIRIEIPFIHCGSHPQNIPELRHARIVQTYRNPKACSCWMCRNPRHSPAHKGKDRLTVQELRHFEAAREQLAE